jgi:ubiquitin carboxyl-terminal hydrolase 34
MAQVIEQRAQKKTAAGGAENKSAAYKLLNSLVRGNPELMGFFFKECVQPLLAHIERTDAWNYTPPSASDRSQAYVGLRNLGCICYMNATLQQLFTIPALRYNLLAVDDGEAENLVECKGEKLDDNAFHQLQKLMANLELSDRSDYNPWEFCFAFKEPDGGPTNTGVQKDADEFLKLVFDRLEEALKGTPRELLLQSLFRGRTCAQLVCQECGHAKSRLEPPTTYMALPVKGRRGVYESL